MNTETLLLYLTTWTVVAVSPGPAVMCVMSQAACHGVRASLAGIGGLQLGSLLFFFAAGSGLVAFLATMTTAFAALRIAGALYLGWLGVSLVVSSFRKNARHSVPAEITPAQGNLFLQGLLIQLTNPKALLFVSALLPQFLDRQRPMLGQLGLLFVITFVVDVASMLTYAMLAVRGAQRFRASGAVVWLERVFGAALLSFGVRLAFDHQ